MGNFKKLFEYANNNNVKALNKSISDIGKQHHTKYIAGMIYNNSLNSCYDSLVAIWNLMQKLSVLINQNNLYKQEIGRRLGYIYGELGGLAEIRMPSEKQIFDIVLRYAFQYYFSIDLRELDGIDSLIQSAVQYRASTNLFNKKMEILKCETEETLHLIQLDSYNISFLYNNYLKFDENNEAYFPYMDLLKKSILNLAYFENGKLEKNYFDIMRRLNDWIKQIT